MAQGNDSVGGQKIFFRRTYRIDLHSKMAADPRDFSCGNRTRKDNRMIAPTKRCTVPLMFILFAFVLNGLATPGSDHFPLRNTFAMPHVWGQIDHMAFDPVKLRLFVAALSTNAIEVIDTRTANLLRPLAGLNKPQGVLYISELKCLAVSNGGNGTVQFYNGESLKRTCATALGKDADHLRYDPSSRLIYAGFGKGALAVLDAASGKHLRDIILPAHPEAFELEASGQRIFVNIPDSGRIAVVDRKQQMVTATWRVKGMRANVPMALDEHNHRLFIGFRKPAKLVVLDTETGREIALLDCAADADDLYYDAANKRIYLSAGAGEIDSFNQLDADRYLRLPRCKTAPGARTSLLIAKRNVLYVAVPPLGARPAQIREYGIR
jgi:hypothetical protein